MLDVTGSGDRQGKKVWDLRMLRNCGDSTNLGGSFKYIYIYNFFFFHPYLRK